MTGLFDSFFSTSGKYPQDEHPLTEKEIMMLVSHGKVMSINQKDEGIIETALLQRRGSDGKISLRQIYEVLTQLFNRRKISKQDKDGLMKVFEEKFRPRA